MENKNKFWKGVLVGVLVTMFMGMILVGAASGVILIKRTVDYQAESQQTEASQTEKQALTQAEKLELDRISQKMELIQQIVDQYYLFDENLEKVEAGIYTGLMFGLEDPYSVYYTEEDFNKLMEDTEGVYCGIGAMVSQNRSTGIISIAKVFEDAPSFEAGLLPGDIIFSVDGTEVTGMDLDLLVGTYIKGEEGTKVKMTVVRGDAAEYVDLEIERRQIEVPTVEHQMLEDKVGYIYVMQFDTITAAQFRAAVDDLETQGMEKLVVDLRSNPGGVLDGVVEMLAYVLPEDVMDGVLVTTSDKDGKGETYFSKDGKLQCKSDYGRISSEYPKKDTHQLDIPIAVLVNENSASASEVFTGAIKDYEWGVIVGTKTFGKGIVQNLIPLGDGTAIKLTTSHYFTPSGFDLHGKGIEPDVVVELDEELKKMAVVPLDEDNQVKAALDELEKLKKAADTE